MPIEIKELLIKVNINQQQEQSPSSAENLGSPSKDEKEELSAEILEQLLEVIKNKNER